MVRFSSLAIHMGGDDVVLHGRGACSVHRASNRLHLAMQAVTIGPELRRLAARPAGDAIVRLGDGTELALREAEVVLLAGAFVIDGVQVGPPHGDRDGQGASDRVAKA